MKKVYNDFIKKYPQVQNKELEELCSIFKNEVDGAVLHSVKLGVKSRELICALPQDFELRAFYEGKASDVFRMELYYKDNRVKTIEKIESKHIFYRIENIKIAIEYTLKKRKSDVDFYLPLYKKLLDIIIHPMENNNIMNWMEEHQRLFKLEENKDLLLNGIIKETQHNMRYSYGYSKVFAERFDVPVCHVPVTVILYEVNEGLLYDILFKELQRFISFQFLVDEVDSNESLIKLSEEKIHNFVNNF